MKNIIEKYLVNEASNKTAAIYSAAAGVGTGVGTYVGLKINLVKLKRRLKDASSPEQKKRIQSQIDEINKKMKTMVASSAAGGAVGGAVGAKLPITGKYSKNIKKGAAATLGAGAGMYMKILKVGREINKLEKQLSQAKTKEEQIYLEYTIEKKKNSALKSIAGAAIAGAVGGVTLFSISRAKLKDAKTIRRLKLNKDRLKQQNSFLKMELMKDKAKYEKFKKFLSKIGIYI